MLTRHKKGQSTLEYAALIAVVVAAIVAINLYMQRGIQGHLRSNADDIGTQYDYNAGGYHSTNNLTSANEVTHSVTGKDPAQDVALGLGWDTAPLTEHGQEAQWTEVPGQRTANEATTSQGAAP